MADVDIDVAVAVAWGGTWKKWTLLASSTGVSTASGAAFGALCRSSDDAQAISVRGPNVPSEQCTNIPTLCRAVITSWVKRLRLQKCGGCAASPTSALLPVVCSRILLHAVPLADVQRSDLSSEAALRESAWS
jgi:hypothetical protein